MGSTYWYADDETLTPSGPFFESRRHAEATADDGVRPIDSSVVPGDAEVRDAGELDEAAPESDATDGDDRPDLDALDYSELKDRAREVGIADETDLRSKESIREGLRAHRD